MEATKICRRCSVLTSPEWWRCCPEHFQETGDDVVCLECKNFYHPICGALNASGYGIMQLCAYSGGHEGVHTWETAPEDQPADPDAMIERPKSKFEDKIPEIVEEPEPLPVSEDEVTEVVEEP